MNSVSINNKVENTYAHYNRFTFYKLEDILDVPIENSVAPGINTDNTDME